MTYIHTKLPWATWNVDGVEIFAAYAVTSSAPTEITGYARWKNTMYQWSAWPGPEGNYVVSLIREGSVVVSEYYGPDQHMEACIAHTIRTVG